MKTSVYNYSHLLPDGTTLFFNFYTLSLIALNPLESKMGVDILSSPNQTNKNKRFLDLKKLLKHHGFIVDEGADEVELLKTQHIKSRKNQDHLSLTIVPTLLCNFNCIYCYQVKKKETMSREVEKALIEFVKNKVAKNGSLSVTWFGGEPLLCLEIIERLSNAFIEICQNQSAKFTSNLITNGFLLHRENAEKLMNLKVDYAQVTLDGVAEIHNPRRPLLGGGETFKTIINNMKEASERIGINIRMNVDGKNRDRILDFLEVLEEEGLKDRVGFYLGQTYPYTSVCQDVSGWCLSDEDFSLLELETAIEMVNRGYTSFNIPKSKNYFCMADCENAYAITPTGGVVKCWNDVANSEVEIMHLTKPLSKTMREIAERRLKRNPFELECMKCSVLPICMGGCPYIFKETGRLQCHDWKHHPKENLFFYYYLKKIEQESEIAKEFWNLLESANKI